MRETPKDHILCDAVHMKIQNREIYRDRNWITGYLGLDRIGELQLKGLGHFCKMIRCFNFTVIMFLYICGYTKKKSELDKCGTCTIYELYLNKSLFKMNIKCQLTSDQT